jgi:hypothetical protein
MTDATVSASVISAASGLIGVLIGAGATSLQQRGERKDERRNHAAEVVVGFIDAVDTFVKVCQRDYYLSDGVTKGDLIGVTTSRKPDGTIEDLHSAFGEASSAHTRLVILVQDVRLRSLADSISDAAEEVYNAIDDWDGRQALRDLKIPVRKLVVGVPIVSNPLKSLERIQDAIGAMTARATQLYSIPL